MGSGINVDEWLKATTDAGLDYPNDPDAITVHEFCEKYTPPLHRATAVRRLDALVRLGKATRTYRFDAAADGRRMKLAAYKLVKSKK